MQVAKRSRTTAGNPPALLQWLRDNTGRRGRHTLAGLAAALGIHPSQVTRIMSNQRRVQLEELPKIANYLGTEVPAGVLQLFGPRAGADGKAAGFVGEQEAMPPRVKVEAVIALGVWRELGATMALAEKERIPPSHDPRLYGMRQYACRIESDGRYAICVRFSDLRQRPRSSDILHVRRKRGGAHEDTLRIANVTRNGKVELRVWNGRTAEGKSLAYPSDDPKEEIELKGLVVGFFTPTQF